MATINTEISDCLVYKLTLADITLPELTLPDGGYFEIWTPKMKLPLRCKRFPIKYNVFWFLHFLNVFSNRFYRAITLKNENRIDAALMVIPKYFRWPFMNKEDVQIIYVISHPSQLRKGLSRLTIYYTLQQLKSLKVVNTVWYVTTSDNIASQNLCKSIGFEFAGYGIREVKFGFIKTLRLE